MYQIKLFNVKDAIGSDEPTQNYHMSFIMSFSSLYRCPACNLTVLVHSYCPHGIVFTIKHSFCSAPKGKLLKLASMWSLCF